jgi:hypothetical protein
MITVAELSEYSNKARKLLNAEEQKNIIDYLSAHPKSGDIVQGTGGIRKLRWKRDAAGKRGGVRVIYYYHNEKIPLYFFTLFGKNQKSNLSKSEQAALAKLVKILITTATLRG